MQSDVEKLCEALIAHPFISGDEPCPCSDCLRVREALAAVRSNPPVATCEVQFAGAGVLHIISIDKDADGKLYELPRQAFYTAELRRVKEGE